jgi:hypothetical protein
VSRQEGTGRLLLFGLMFRKIIPCSRENSKEAVADSSQHDKEDSTMKGKGRKYQYFDRERS